MIPKYRAIDKKLENNSNGKTNNLRILVSPKGLNSTLEDLGFSEALLNPSPTF